MPKRAEDNLVAEAKALVEKILDEVDREKVEEMVNAVSEIFARHEARMFDVHAALAALYAMGPPPEDDHVWTAAFQLLVLHFRENIVQSHEKPH